MNRQIHLIMPFYRHENKEALTEAYKPMRIILHPIMFQDEEAAFNEAWIKPLIIPTNTGDCPAEMIECFKRNWFIKTSEIVDEDYYVTVDDDDMYEDGVFDTVKDIDEDIVIISMKRGFNIPDNVGELRQHPNDTLWAHPDNVSPGRISGQQSFIKGKIFKLHLFNESSNIWDGEMATYHKETKTIRYESDLFALFNYYEPGRWIKKENNLTSIIIPVYNQHEMTDECIRLLDETVSEYELIVIDNGSDPFYTPRDPATGFRYHENKGFPIAVNQGVGIATGENIVVLNNDTMVTPNAISRLIKWLDVYDIVGPVTNYSAGVQQVQIPIYKDIDELNKVAGTYMAENKGQSEAARFIIGFCMVFKRSTFNHIGAFDDSLWPCSGEEIDFCYDKETQIVTRDGIKYFYDLTLNDEFLTKNDDAIIEYQKPTEIISRKEETLLHFCSKSVDIKCSKKQNLLVGYDRKYYDYKKGGTKEIEFITAEDINAKLWKNQSRYYIENASGIWEGKTFGKIEVAGRERDTKAYVKFMAWYLSEGHVECDANKRRIKRTNEIRIGQFDKEKYELIYETIVTMGILPNRYKNCVAFSDKELCDYLVVFGKSWEKYIPEEIKELSSEMLELFLEIYLIGDGNRAKSGNRKTWYTSSSRMKDDLIELLIKTQQPFTFGLHGGGKMKFKNGTYECRPVWSIQSSFGTDINKRGRVSLKKAKEVQYNDITFDVRVPNKRIYIIRNGKGCWSSNCLRAHQKGYKIGIAHDVYVHHIGSCTIQDLESAGQINCTEVFSRNDKHLAQKWGDDFWQKQLIQERQGKCNSRHYPYSPPPTSC